MVDVTCAEPEEVEPLRCIKWCDGHWEELLFSLRERGLGDQIAEDADALNQKFVQGKLDPCWEGSNMINMGALEIFGPDRVVEENAGCPVCAFANIVPHVGDLMARKYGTSH